MKVPSSVVIDCQTAITKGMVTMMNTVPRAGRRIL
jgi:hypothetical protein